MRKHGLYITVILLLNFNILLLTGCDVQIFERKKDPYEVIPYKKEELVTDIYYVKDGTSFYPLYKNGGTATSVVREPSDSRLLWFMKDLPLIPTYYQNETIALPSLNTGLYNSVIERFSDIGYSMGLYGGIYGDDGIYLNSKENCVPGSSFEKQVSSLGTSDIKIVKINDAPVSQGMLNQSGVITGLQEQATYKVGFYAGSKYLEKDIIADVWFLKSFEIFSLEKADATPNGYLALQFPEDFKSGYYLVNGFGVCRYYNAPKSNVTGDEDMNEPYYTSSVEQMAVFSQQYVKEIPYLASDVTFTVTYDAETLLEGQEAKAYLTSPQGERYNFNPGKSTDQTASLTISLNEASPGKWQINTFPKDLKILDVVMDSAESASENKKEVFNFHFDEAMTNIIFYVTYEGLGNINAIMIGTDGDTYNYVFNKSLDRLEYNASYLPAGDYEVYVYHQIDTSVDEVDWEEDTAQYETDIITIEE